MKQLIASYELAIGCECTATLSPICPAIVPGSFCLEKSMSDIIQLTPNKWVSEEVLIAITGLTKNAIKSARTNSWMEGREYRHYSGDCQPKENSPILYNRHEVDNWVERQRPAIPRQKSA